MRLPPLDLIITTDAFRRCFLGFLGRAEESALIYTLQTSFTSMMKLFLAAASLVATANAQAGAGTVGCAEVDTDGNGERPSKCSVPPTAGRPARTATP